MPYLDVICVAGWGNRLQPLVSGMRLARKYGYTLRVFWPKQVYFPCSFSDIFTNQDFEISEDQSLYQDVLERKATNRRSYGNNRHDQQDGTIAHFEPTQEDWSVYTHKIFLTTGEFMWSQPRSILDIHEPYLWELRQEFNRLQPNPEIKQMILDTIYRFKTDPIVGIHLRKPEILRLDKLMRPEFTNWAWLPDKTIRYAIDDFINADQNVRFFLSTNCKPTENRFVKKYGERMIVQQKTVRSLLWDYSNEMEWAYHTYSTSQAIKEAFVDLTCLSRTDYIMRNWMSTFSSFASLIHGTNMNLKV